MRMGLACDASVQQWKQLESVCGPQHRLEAFILTPELIRDLHKVLTRDILPMLDKTGQRGHMAHQKMEMFVSFKSPR